MVAATTTALRPNEQDSGPYCIDHLRAIWGRFARTADALRAVAAIPLGGEDLRLVVQTAAEAGNEAISNPTITRVLRILAAQDGMHAGDWLRMRAAEAVLPRRKTPPAVELQIRLRGLNCKRLVVKIADREHYRVTIQNVRGDVASAESASLTNALEGAIKMAGARGETTDEDD